MRDIGQLDNGDTVPRSAERLERALDGSDRQRRRRWKLYVGVGACAAGLAACEAAEFAPPSDALCVSGPSIRGDLDCNAGPGQHPKTVYATSLASVSTGSTT